MNDVEILAEEIVYKFNPFNSGFWLVASISLVVFGGAIVITCIQNGHYDSKDFIGMLIVLLIVIFAISFLTGVAVDELYPTGAIDYIEYQVIIDDSVSINEFLDHYEILGQNGKIYTVKERNLSP